MAEQKYPIPDLSNATPGHCIDQIAICREEQKRGKFYEGIYRKRLDATKDKDATSVKGEHFVGEFTPTLTERISADEVRAFFERWSPIWKTHLPEDQQPQLSEVIVISDGSRLNVVALPPELEPEK